MRMRAPPRARKMCSSHLLRKLSYDLYIIGLLQTPFLPSSLISVKALRVQDGPKIVQFLSILLGLGLGLGFSK